jgi:hypothetical protein
MRASRLAPDAEFLADPESIRASLRLGRPDSQERDDADRARPDAPMQQLSHALPRSSKNAAGRKGRRRIAYWQSSHPIEAASPDQLLRTAQEFTAPRPSGVGAI